MAGELILIVEDRQHTLDDDFTRPTRPATAGEDDTSPDNTADEAAPDRTEDETASEGRRKRGRGPGRS